ncbi:MAG: DUF3368 domain-containing protein [Candidatus Latescibacterota bacterium]
MKVVANATPLIALALLDRLTLLPALFREVLVPPAVYDEVVVRGADRAGGAGLACAAWLTVQDPATPHTIEPVLLGLDAGEFEVLLLARSVQPDWVLIDERLGRRVAQAMGLPVKGTIGLLLAGYRAGLLTQDEALSCVPRLAENGIRIHPKVSTWFQDELRRP